MKAKCDFCGWEDELKQWTEEMEDGKVFQSYLCPLCFAKRDLPTVSGDSLAYCTNYLADKIDRSIFGQSPLHIAKLVGKITQLTTQLDELTQRLGSSREIGTISKVENLPQIKAEPEDNAEKRNQ